MPINLPEVTSGYNLSLINDNFQTIESQWDEKLDRLVSTQANQMEQDLDMNSNKILNHAPTDFEEPTSLVRVDALNEFADFTGAIPVVASYVGDGTTVAFPKPVNANDARTFQVYVGGLRQEPYADYQIVGETVVFTQAPVLDVSVDIYGYSPTVIENGAPVYADPILANFIGDGNQTNFFVSAQGSSTDSAFISIDGVNQVPNVDFTNAGGAISFTEAPPLNSEIFVRIFAPFTNNATDSFVLADGSTQPRTLGDRFGNIVHIEDFGAVGDGVIDDSSSILAAIASASDGDTLIGDPAKEYACTNIVVDKALTIQDTSFSSNSVDFPLFDIKSDDVSFLNCRLDAKSLRLPYDAPNVGRDSCINVLDTSNPFNNLKVIGCELLNAGRDCIYINSQNSIGHVISGNNFIGASRNLISVVSGDGGVVSGNTFQDWALAAIDYETNPGTTGEVHNWVTDSNVFHVNELSSGAAVNLKLGTGNPADTCTDCIVSNNIVQGNPLATAQATMLNNNDFLSSVFTGNIIKNCAGGIGTNVDAVITDNIITGRNAFTLGVLSSKGAINGSGLIANNFIEDYPFFGIVALNDNVKVTGNVIRNVGTEVAGMSGIYFYDSIGTYGNASITDNSMRDMDRGIYIRNSIDLDMMMIGNSYVNVNTNLISSASNYDIRADNETLYINGEWDNVPMRFGNRYEWYDASGNKRAKNGAPTSITDGVIISQNPVV